MTTSPQDDLTAERAAIALLEQMGLYGHPAASQFVGDIIAALKAARQEALREAIDKVTDRALLWRSHGGAKMAFPYDHLTVEGECDAIASILDRLASEGAPSPIDLSSKFNDDGGYGEHF